MQNRTAYVYLEVHERFYHWATLTQCQGRTVTMYRWLVGAFYRSFLPEIFPAPIRFFLILLCTFCNLWKMRFQCARNSRVQAKANCSSFYLCLLQKVRLLSSEISVPLSFFCVYYNTLLEGILWVAIITQPMIDDVSIFNQ